MTLYAVSIRNETTGEITVLSQEAGAPELACEAALNRAFRERGWHKATAVARKLNHGTEA